MMKVSYFLYTLNETYILRLRVWSSYATLLTRALGEQSKTNLNLITSCELLGLYILGSNMVALR